ncbi:Endonuclease/exonuclease/phosphatase [Entophlyctis helioformis]|nr:Endonuclease/exonuclease/phosphatase [Entophlyctis helioformis]
MARRAIKVRVGTWNVATRTLDGAGDMAQTARGSQQHAATTAGQHPADRIAGMDLAPWLWPASSNSAHDDDLPDLVVVGFQELLHQATAAFAVGQQASYWTLPTPLPAGAPAAATSAAAAAPNRQGAATIDCLEPWIWLVQDALCRGSRGSSSGGKSSATSGYRVVCAARQVAVGIIVLVRTTTDPAAGPDGDGDGEGAGDAVQIGRIGTGGIGSGLFGLYGNKGALAVSLDVWSGPEMQSLCFMCCHLGAHEGEGRCIWRNQEVDWIFDTLVMTDTVRLRAGHPGQPGQPAQGAGGADQKESLRVRLAGDHDALWMFGDLNYRISGTKSDAAARWAVDAGAVSESPKRSRVLELVRDKNVEQLLQMDEVSVMRRHRHGTLGQLHEHAIGFLPTYKFKQTKAIKKSTSTGTGGSGGSVTVVRQPDALLGGMALEGTAVSSGEAVRKEFSSKRLPAYCDRILYSGRVAAPAGTRAGTRAGQADKADKADSKTCYWSEHGYGWSDHVPVAGDYEVHGGGGGEGGEGVVGRRATREIEAGVGWFQMQRRVERGLRTNQHLLLALVVAAGLIVVRSVVLAA